MSTLTLTRPAPATPVIAARPCGCVAPTAWDYTCNSLGCADFCCIQCSVDPDAHIKARKARS